MFVAINFENYDNSLNVYLKIYVYITYVHMLYTNLRAREANTPMF